LRLSVGKYTTKEDIKEAVNIIVNYTKSKHWLIVILSI
jgi:hypothetical protein